MQNTFNIQELLCMAALCDQDQICGVPDIFSVLADDDAQRLLQETMDNLMNRNVLTMDFDGAYSLQEDYEELIDVCCNCLRCFSFTCQKPDGESSAMIFWQAEDVSIAAVVTGVEYEFYLVDNDVIGGFIEWDATGNALAVTASIPTAMLNKAKKRYAEEKEQEARRILYQNGVTEPVASVIMDGFGNHAEFLELHLIENKDGEFASRKKSYLGSRSMVLELSESVVNFRPSMVFTSVDSTAIKNTVAEFAGTFIQE